MPQLKQFVLNNTYIYLWEINKDTLEKYLPLVESDIHHEKRRNQRASIYRLMEGMNISYRDLHYTEEGKPLIKEGHISFSHKDNYIIGATSAVDLGVDIERIQEKIMRIRHKFCSEQELKEFTTIEDYTRIWAIKECVYKILGKETYSFKNEIHVYKSGEQWQAEARGKTFRADVMDYENYCIALVLDNE